MNLINYTERELIIIRYLLQQAAANHLIESQELEVLLFKTENKLNSINQLKVWN